MIEVKFMSRIHLTSEWTLEQVLKCVLELFPVRDNSNWLDLEWILNFTVTPSWVESRCNFSFSLLSLLSFFLFLPHFLWMSHDSSLKHTSENGFDLHSHFSSSHLLSVLVCINSFSSSSFLFLFFSLPSSLPLFLSFLPSSFLFFFLSLSLLGNEKSSS